MKKPIAVLISGNGSNLQALIEACAREDYPARIALVFSNKTDAYGLERARQAGIATQAFSHKDYADRARFDAALHDLLIQSGVECVCLAGFMRLLTPEFTEKWRGRMINIHPSLLPLFKGLHTHAEALAAGVRLHGCSVHHVTPGMDEGPLIAQACVRVLPGDTPETLGKRVLQAEHLLYPAALAHLIDPASPSARLSALPDALLNLF